jgi:hypothetical protein
MEDKVKIFCCSRSRFKDVKTLKIVPELTLVVNYDQAHKYKEYNPNTEVISLPEGLSGITHARQWLLNNFDEFFMIDDDIYELRVNYNEPNERAAINDIEMGYRVIENARDLAREFGVKMYGFPSTRRPVAYNAHQPYSFAGYFNNSYCGILKNHNLSYNLTMGEAEDYYLSLMNARINRKSFMDNRFTFVTEKNFVGTGGVCEYRTTEMMIENTIKLRKLFGNAVVIKKASSIRRRVNLGERTLRIPLG